MQQLPIQAVPNQSFSAVLDTNTWDFIIKSTDGCICVSLTLNSVDVVDNARAVAGAFIIPDVYQEAGNFFFITQNFQLPDYTLFNTNQYFVYISAAELSTLRAPAALPITASDFNPIAALPLRFSPQGY